MNAAFSPLPVLDQHEMLCRDLGLPSPLDARLKLALFYVEFRNIPELADYFDGILDLGFVLIFFSLIHLSLGETVNAIFAQNTDVLSRTHDGIPPPPYMPCPYAVPFSHRTRIFSARRIPPPPYMPLICPLYAPYMPLICRARALFSGRVYRLLTWRLYACMLVCLIGSSIQCCAQSIT